MKNSVKILGLVAVIVVLFSNLIENQDANVEKTLAMSNSAQNKEVTSDKKHVTPYVIVKRDL
jgi:hypothetical protein